MNKEQQIEELAKDINNTWFVKSNGDICGTNVKLKKNDIKMIAHQLVLEGYRKTFTSDFASDTQKANKEGYIKSIEETVEKPVDTSNRKYESINGIVSGFVVKDGKVLYVTNILDGYRHEFKDIYEICDELNNDMKEIDRLMESNNHLRFQLEECKKSTVKEFVEKLQKELPCRDYTFNGNTYSMILTSSVKFVIDKLLKEYENGKSL